MLRVVAAYPGNVSASLVPVGGLSQRQFGRRHVGHRVHNHPSRDSTPLPDDLHLTAEALAAGRLLDVHIFEHVVVGSGGYASLRDRGVSFDR
jgi:DNA repair protein RadC